jgi:DNA-binding CsgD family transcriptional regulator/tetratricopeptide (TPR) repeat protein
VRSSRTRRTLSPPRRRWIGTVAPAPALCDRREVPEATSEPGARIVGREAELAALGEFVAGEGAPRGLVLTGDPGIGKTALWEAGIELARRSGLRVLATRASCAETMLSFAALIDLLDDVALDELAAVPGPQRHALEVALFRAEPTGGPPGEAAIGVGLLNTLRALAAHEPLLVAIDDVQWLDSASDEALAFAARRLEEQPVRFLLATRSGSASLLERAHGPTGVQRVEVAPLSLGATQLLLAERLELRLSRHAVRRVVQATLGNPLFALELGRLLAEREPLDPGEDVPLPDTVDELLGTRVAALPAPARRIVLAVALSGDVRLSQVAELATEEGLDEAVDAGVLLLDGDRVRPANPLFATAAKQAVRRDERRELHLVLSSLAADEESRALHLALATDDPEPEVADGVAAAAAAAAARGAREEAVVLGDHALRLTPHGSADRSERVLALGAYLLAAGEAERATKLLTRELATLPPGAPRARALLLLTEGTVTTNDEIRSHLHEALRESAGDARLHAAVVAEIAANDAVARVERLAEAETGAQEAVKTGRRAGADLERSGLYALAWARVLRGHAIDDVCDRYREVSDDAPYLVGSPERMAALRLVWRGDFAGARAALTGLRSVADERGEPVSYALQRLHLCELELRTGAWDDAERLLDEWQRDGELLTWPCDERCRALLAAGRGLVEEAERWAGAAIDQARRTGIAWDLLEASRARGIGALLTGDLVLAGESLGAVWEHLEREGVEEIGAFPVAPDLVEALTDLGELDEARTVTDRQRRLSEQQDHPWGLITTRRCAALVRLATPDDREEEAAAAELEEVADAYAAVGLRFDQPRTRLALGKAQRRGRRWGAARATLERAAVEFDELGSPGWAERARAELARVGGRPRRSSGELTPAEQHVAGLVAEGLTNREIGRRLSMSSRTVEVHLKHAYAKLGVRSRSQLARRLSARA